MADTRYKSNPRVVAISTTQIFEDFDSLTVCDVGSSGFRVMDENGNIAAWPTGVPLNVAGKTGKLASKITILAPESGTLNAVALFYY